MASKQAISDKTMGTQDSAPKRKVVFDETLFTAGVVGMLKTYSNITDDSDIDDINRAVSEIVELWEIEHEGKKYGGYTTAPEALQSITGYILEHGYLYTRPLLYRIDDFSVSITIPTKTAGATATFTRNCSALGDDTDTAMRAAYMELAAYVTENFKSGPVQRTPIQGTQTEKPEDEPFEFTTLRMVSLNGKLVARLIPLQGRWTQYGVPLYADVANKAGIPLSEYMQPGDYELAGSGIIQYKPDGKPMRANSVELA